MRALWQWMRENMFSTPLNSALSIAGIALLLWSVPPALDFLFFGASWSGGREACTINRDGACWPFVYDKLGQFIYGFYTIEERWRVNIVFALFFGGIFLCAYERVPYRRYIALFMLVIFPVLAWVLMQGGLFGLPIVYTESWGGLMLTIVIASTGIVVSLPLGVVLALGRRSEMPIIRSLSVAFIEFWRGVPLITVLFMAAFMFPLFLPEGVTVAQLIRAMAGFALFAAAYMAEVVRGGLQSLSLGQYEGAKALGLSYWRMNRLVILPQALKVVIPGIVNTFIGLFKDTTLVLIIGLFDLLGIMQATFSDPTWALPTVAITSYSFIAFVFFVFCYAMSLYSRYYERRHGIKSNKSG